MNKECINNSKKFSIKGILKDTEITNVETKDIKIEVSQIKNNNHDTKLYWQLLKDPRWQEMRLKIMERDGFSCFHCYDNKKTLNVHHLIYIKDAKPWEYNPDDLITLCEECHDKLTKSINEVTTIIKKSAISKSRFYAICNIVKSINNIMEDM